MGLEVDFFQRDHATKALGDATSLEYRLGLALWDGSHTSSTLFLERLLSPGAPTLS
jgi:hypothetical protein